jgi:hypothetical protein
MATDASPNGLSSEGGSAVEHGTAPADIVLGDPDRGCGRRNWYEAARSKVLTKTRPNVT